jgi:pimeloyl-ACP methyl ester carboxylesterase
MFPFLERLNARHVVDGLTVLGISQDSANITRSFARRYGITFPLLLEGDDYPVSRAFDIMATPTVFLIEPGGTVAYATMGFMKPALDALGDAVRGARAARRFARPRRSTRTDGTTQNTIEEHANDLHRLIAAIDAGPVDLFASSGGAVNALALVAKYPDDVRTLAAP